MSRRPKRPYLLRALYDWIVDSELTPYLLVGVDSDRVQVPTDYVSDGKIVLNVSPMAIRELLIDAEVLSFDGRFGGKPFPVVVPLASVQAIYAKETGEGMMFEDDEYANDAGDGPADDDPGGPPKSGADHLKVVK